ncbi:MAG: agmatine deiminase family protein [bacterium]
MNQHSIFLSSLLLNKKYSKFLLSFSDIFTKHGIKHQFLSGTNDIWLRDFMPIQAGTNEFVQFTLTRDYYYKRDRHKRTDPAPICKSLGIKPTPILYNGVPVYLDGGNVIRGFGKAIITEKVFDDNEIPRDDLENLLKESLKVEQVIFIPVEPLDETGHADGMVRWVNEHTVVANDYSRIDVPQSFRDRFYGTLGGSGLDVLRVPYQPIDEKINGYSVATGCYINFLQVGDKIFLPTFSDPVKDDEAIKRFGEIFGDANVIPVFSGEIALGGGVLNCLSWEIM